MQKRNYASKSKTISELILLRKYLPPCKRQKFRQNRLKTIISRDICKKRNYASKSKTIWELILLIKYLPLYKRQKIRQNRRKSIISRDKCKKRNYASKSKTIWELNLLIKYLLVWSPENFVKIAVKPLFHEIHVEIEIMARNQ